MIFSFWHRVCPLSDRRVSSLRIIFFDPRSFTLDLTRWPETKKLCWKLSQLCALLYKKCLRLNADGRRKITIGKIVNIMSVDVNRCDRILIPFSQVATSPILLAVAIWQIYERMGMAIWGALGTTLFFLFLNIGQERIQGHSWSYRVIKGHKGSYWIIWGQMGSYGWIFAKGKVIGTYRAIISKKTDRRVRLLGEMINSMRIIKMYVWEGFFLQKLMRYRKEEMKKHRQKLYFYGFFDSILKSSSKYLIAITISIYFSRSKSPNL